jgi:hypothetical protein
MRSLPFLLIMAQHCLFSMLQQHLTSFREGEFASQPEDAAYGYFWCCPLHFVWWTWRVIVVLSLLVAGPGQCLLLLELSFVQSVWSIYVETMVGIMSIILVLVMMDGCFASLTSIPPLRSLLVLWGSYASYESYITLDVPIVLHTSWPVLIHDCLTLWLLVQILSLFPNRSQLNVELFRLEY